MTALCFMRKSRPAGNDYAGPYSAYCATCQPRDTRPQPRASQCACAACGRIFATLTDFDRHQETYPRGHDLEGVLTGRCFDPALIGLELAGDVWGTPAGNAKRERLAAGMAGVRGAKPRVHAQADEQPPTHISARAEPPGRPASLEGERVSSLP